MCGIYALQIKRSSIRKGMVMVSPRLNPLASWEFEAEILVLHHPTTISPRYQAMGEKPDTNLSKVFLHFTIDSDPDQYRVIKFKNK